MNHKDNNTHTFKTLGLFFNWKIIMKINLKKYKQKTKKFIKNPIIFSRDYLNKYYPQSYTELKIDEVYELALSSYIESDYVTVGDDMAVDVVYTWVDNTDNQWQEKYKYYKNQDKQNNIGAFATDIARFSNHNELYYSIKSVKKFLPWVRNIYIVTDEQIPLWLHEFSDIFLINHSDIIDKKYLPTFNSHVIESFLYKIPNLSENFIYFNDDVFVAKSLEKKHFFSANNLASLFISAKNLQDMKNKKINTATLHACFNSINLLKNHYQISINNTLIHTYYPLKKSAYEKAWQLYKKEIESYLSNKFRSNNDINMATFLVPWLMYCEAKSTERIDVCYYFNIRSPSAVSYYRQLLELKEKKICPHSFCANDFNTENPNQLADYNNKLLVFLNSYYD